MLLKHVYMDWKFQRTLKLDISFGLENFFHLSSNLHTSCYSAFKCKYWNYLLAYESLNECLVKCKCSSFQQDWWKIKAFQ